MWPGQKARNLRCWGKNSKPKMTDIGIKDWKLMFLWDINAPWILTIGGNWGMWMDLADKYSSLLSTKPFDFLKKKTKEEFF